MKIILSYYNPIKNVSIIHLFADNIIIRKDDIYEKDYYL